MTHDEYVFLKKWMELHPKQQLASPCPANELMQRLIDVGYLLRVTKPDASNSGIILVSGYVVTIAGEEAVKRYQDNTE
jgi:hypothetical protein